MKIQLEVKYRNISGFHLLLPPHARLDIYTAVAILSQSFTIPPAFTVNSVKVVFDFLSATRNYGIGFNLKEGAMVIRPFFSEGEFAGTK